MEEEGVAVVVVGQWEEGERGEGLVEEHASHSGEKVGGQTSRFHGDKSSLLSTAAAAAAAAAGRERGADRTLLSARCSALRLTALGGV